MSNSKELKVKYHGNKDKPVRKKNPNVASISKLGYRDDSPYRSLPYIDIDTPSGRIDMSNTGIPLWANGRILPPYSGIHKFDSETVREIPLAQDGQEVYNMERAKQLGYTPNEAGHWPSVDYETGEWLKSKEHPSAWMEYLYGYTLNPQQALNYDVRTNPQGYFGDNTLQYVPKQKKGGLTQAQDGKESNYLYPERDPNALQYLKDKWEWNREKKKLVKDYRTGALNEDAVEWEGYKIPLFKDESVKRIVPPNYNLIGDQLPIPAGLMRTGGPLPKAYDQVKKNWLSKNKKQTGGSLTAEDFFYDDPANPTSTPIYVDNKVDPRYVQYSYFMNNVVPERMAYINKNPDGKPSRPFEVLTFAEYLPVLKTQIGSAANDKLFDDIANMKLNLYINESYPMISRPQEVIYDPSKVPGFREKRNYPGGDIGAVTYEIRTDKDKWERTSQAHYNKVRKDWEAKQTKKTGGLIKAQDGKEMRKRVKKMTKGMRYPVVPKSTLEVDDNLLFPVDDAGLPAPGNPVDRDIYIKNLPPVQWLQERNQWLKDNPQQQPMMEARHGGWLKEFQGTDASSETGKGPGKYRVSASDLERRRLQEQGQNYYNSGDLFYSEQEYEKDKQNIADRVNLCKTKGEGCLSTANYWYNKFVAPQLGNPSSWDELTYSGVNSTEENTYDSWDVHGLNNRRVLYNSNTYPDKSSGPKAENIWKELDLPIGAIVGYGEHASRFQKPGEVSLNKKKGLPESGHSGRIVAYDKDTGEPWVFDSVNGLKKISQNAYFPISVISIDDRIVGNTYSNLQKGKHVYSGGNSVPIEIQWDDFIDENGNVVSWDEDEYKPFMQSFVNNKPTWQGILGLDDKTYNEYARIAGALAISETEGGNDNTWRYGLPSYILDKMGLTTSTGITQLNQDVVKNLYEKNREKFNRYGLFLSINDKTKSRREGRLYDFNDPDPQDAAFITMMLLKDNKANAERLFKKGKINNPNLTDADKQWYTWNQQQTLLKGEAQGDATMLKKFRDAYNKIRVTEGKQPKLAEKKTGGSIGWLKQYQGTQGSSQVNLVQAALNQANSSFQPTTTAVRKAMITPVPFENEPIPELVNIKDTRKIHPVTGQPVNPNRDLKSGRYNADIIRNIIRQGKALGFSKDEVLDNLAISFQESMFGKTDPSIGHAEYGDYKTGKMNNVQVLPDIDMELDRTNAEIRNQYLNYKYNTQMINKNPNSDAERLQWYNTPYPKKGQLNTGTEKEYHTETGRSTNRFYGVDVTKAPLKATTLPYGKTVVSLRDSLIAPNADIQKMLKQAGYKQKGGSLPKAQFGIPGKFKKKLADPTYGYGAQWLADWYNNPETQKRLQQSGLSQEDLNYAFENMGDTMISQTYPETMANVKKSLFKDGLKSNKVNDLMGLMSDDVLTSMQGVRGFASDPEEGLGIVYVDPGTVRRKEATLPHELMHASTLDRKIAGQLGAYGYTFPKMKEFYPDLYKAAKKSKDKGAINDMFQAIGSDDEQGMFREIYPYIQSVRYEMGIKPGETITQEMLDNYAKSYEEKAAKFPQRHVTKDSSLDRLLKLYSKPKLIDFMNTVAYNPNEQEVPMARFGGLPMHQVPPGQTKATRDSLSSAANRVIGLETTMGASGGNPIPSYAGRQGDWMSIADKISGYGSAANTAQVADWLWRAGWDWNAGQQTINPKAYILGEYYRKNKSYDPKDWDDRWGWTGRSSKTTDFDKEYANTVGKLSDKEQQVLVNLGKDWFFKNRYTNQNDFYGQNPDGSYKRDEYGAISSDYKNVWAPGIRNMYQDIMLTPFPKTKEEAMKQIGLTDADKINYDEYYRRQTVPKGQRKTGGSKLPPHLPEAYRTGGWLKKYKKG